MDEDLSLSIPDFLRATGPGTPHEFHGVVAWANGKPEPRCRELFPLTDHDRQVIDELLGRREATDLTKGANRIAKMKARFEVKALPKDARWDSDRNRWTTEGALRARGLKMRALERANLAAGKRGGIR